MIPTPRIVALVGLGTAFILGLSGFYWAALGVGALGAVLYFGSGRKPRPAKGYEPNPPPLAPTPIKALVPVLSQVERHADSTWKARPEPSPEDTATQDWFVALLLFVQEPLGANDVVYALRAGRVPRGMTPRFREFFKDDGNVRDIAEILRHKGRVHRNGRYQYEAAEGEGWKEEWDTPFDLEFERLAEDLDELATRSRAEEMIDELARDWDTMLRAAAEVCIKNKGGSTSLLQRRLALGYGRSARIVDQLQDVGFLGPSDGSKPCAVLMTMEELDRRTGLGE